MATQIHGAGPTGERSPGLDLAIAGYLVENPPAGGGGGSTTVQIGTVTLPESPTEGQSVSVLADSDTVLPEDVTWDSGGEPVITERMLLVFVWSGTDWVGTYGPPIPAASEPPDETDPTPGTLAASAITDTSFTLTVTGASDETALHAQPYRFSTDNGATYSTWQTSAVFNATELDAETEYDCVHQVRDAALNVATGSSIPVETTAAPGGVAATGGTVTESGGYRIHTFTSNADLVIMSGGQIEYLLVAGGGGGNTCNTRTAGGGGGGGVLTGTATLAPGTYPVVIGPGGTGRPGGSGTEPAGNGGNSTFNGLTAIGGGGAAGSQNVLGNVGQPGGSGGGGGYLGDGALPNGFGGGGAGTSGQGYKGGDAYPVSHGGGGGGASGPGGDSTDYGVPEEKGGDGGPGHTSTISGVSVIYATGGPGAAGGLAAPGGAAIGNPPAANQGHGGAAGMGNSAGQDGSAGVLTIRYPL